ncbi:MAG: DUF6279 family lipoprotein [Thermodesulfobacteriota bacterium]
MKKFPFLFCICLLLFSCGPKLIYTNLDRLVPRYANDYISLDREQRTLLERRLADQLAWHCQTQLDRYAAFLDRLHSDFRDPDRPIDHARMQDYYSTIRQAWDALLHRLGPDAARILATADEAQIAELYENLAEKNREIAEKYIEVSSEERIKERQKRMEKRLRRWISRLTPEQEAEVAAWSEAFDPIAEDRLAFRKRVQNAFRQVLNRRRQEDFEPAFTHLLTHFRELRHPAYQNKMKANTRRTLDLLVRLERMLTPSQRDHLLDRLESYSKTFAELSCESEPTINGSTDGT